VGNIRTLVLNFKSSPGVHIGRICSYAKSLWRYNVDVWGYFGHEHGALRYRVTRAAKATGHDNSSLRAETIYDHERAQLKVDKQSGRRG
jgi:hypothetical protein